MHLNWQEHCCFIKLHYQALQIPHVLWSRILNIKSFNSWRPTQGPNANVFLMQIVLIGIFLTRPFAPLPPYPPVAVTCAIWNSLMSFRTLGTVLNIYIFTLPSLGHRQNWSSPSEGLDRCNVKWIPKTKGAKISSGVSIWNSYVPLLPL